MNNIEGKQTNKNHFRLIFKQNSNNYNVNVKQCDTIGVPHTEPISKTAAVVILVSVVKLVSVVMLVTVMLQL